VPAPATEVTTGAERPGWVVFTGGTPWSIGERVSTTIKFAIVAAR